MAKDPTCGMEVEEQDAIELEYNGQFYYFCSESCRETFKNNPTEYLNKKTS